MTRNDPQIHRASQRQKLLTACFHPDKTKASHSIPLLKKSKEVISIRVRIIVSCRGRAEGGESAGEVIVFLLVLGTGYAVFTL